MGVAELGFFTLSVEDLDKGIEFYSAVMDWQIDAHGLVTNTKFGVSLSADGPMDAKTVYFSVDDLDRTIETVQAMGGKVLQRLKPRSGDLAICEDNQGTVFSVRKPAPGFE